MPHLTATATPTRTHRIVDAHYGSVPEPGRQRLRETIREANGYKVNPDGSIQMPAIVVTPDDPEVPEHERLACIEMGAEVCRNDAPFTTDEIATLGRVAEELGSGAATALSAVGAFAYQNRQLLLDFNAWVSGGNYAVTKRLGAFAEA